MKVIWVSTPHTTTLVELEQLQEYDIFQLSLELNSNTGVGSFPGVVTGVTTDNVGAIESYTIENSFAGVLLFQALSWAILQDIFTVISPCELGFIVKVYVLGFTWLNAVEVPFEIDRSHSKNQVTSSLKVTVIGILQSDVGEDSELEITTLGVVVSILKDWDDAKYETHGFRSVTLTHIYSQLCDSVATLKFTSYTLHVEVWSKGFGYESAQSHRLSEEYHHSALKISPSTSVAFIVISSLWTAVELTSSTKFTTGAVAIAGIVMEKTKRKNEAIFAYLNFINLHIVLIGKF